MRIVVPYQLTRGFNDPSNRTAWDFDSALALAKQSVKVEIISFKPMGPCATTAEAGSCSGRAQASAFENGWKRSDNSFLSGVMVPKTDSRYAGARALSHNDNCAKAGRVEGPPPTRGFLERAWLATFGAKRLVPGGRLVEYNNVHNVHNVHDDDVGLGGETGWLMMCSMCSGRIMLVRSIDRNSL